MFIPHGGRRAMNIKYEEQVHRLERIPLGAPLQDVVTPLPDNHVTLTSPYISSNLIGVHSTVLLRC